MNTVATLTEPAATAKKYRPFANGTQYGDWDDSNCGACIKSAAEGSPTTCDIQSALDDALIDDGTISEDIARRMGYLDNVRAYCWACPEFEAV